MLQKSSAWSPTPCMGWPMQKNTKKKCKKPVTVTLARAQGTRQFKTPKLAVCKWGFQSCRHAVLFHLIRDTECWKWQTSVKDSFLKVIRMCSIIWFHMISYDFIWFHSALAWKTFCGYQCGRPLTKPFWWTSWDALGCTPPAKTSDYHPFIICNIACHMYIYIYMDIICIYDIPVCIMYIV